MKSFIKIVVICLMIISGNFSISVAGALNIDGVLVRGGEVEGSICCMKTIFNKEGKYNLDDPRTFNAALPAFNRNYVYQIKVLSADFLTTYGLYGLNYKDDRARPITRSVQQKPIRHNGRLWSESVIAYNPTWDGVHYLKIMAKNVAPGGTRPATRTGYIHIVVYRWKIVKDEDPSPPCPAGQCGYASTFGTTNCRKSSPSCGGGMCGSPGCP